MDDAAIVTDMAVSIVVFGDAVVDLAAAVAAIFHSEWLLLISEATSINRSSWWLQHPTQSLTDRKSGYYRLKNVNCPGDY